MKLALIQSDIVWEDKNANIKQLEQYIEQIKSDVSIILLPEMFTTGFTMQSEKYAETMDGETVLWMKKQAKSKNALIIGSVIILELGKYYNRLILAFPDGHLKHYNKKHLFTMGEEPKHYSAGNEPLEFEYLGLKIKAIICYDLRFPVWCRNASNYDLLICVANWPEVRSYPWRQLLIARAIENQCYVAAVNRVGLDGNNINHSGNSMVVDAKGEVLQEMVTTAGIIIQQIDLELLKQFRMQFPVLKDQDAFSFE